eukprot:CAMPEP_0197177674 /NCGR_PEP_ID=MMETSP1423-20130617/3200_1 /TAXON_ID=476441 /ORGANISM="Pseudo-nitzschia heimii, Strain UNC1101" /LENGTH=305 /DNA_ID=CAMNT_0042627263 /DNA_START=87 /DNA_END=1004 /DNA_ORIENTATION=-
MADEGPPPPPSASVWTMPADPERFPHVVIRGAAANLSALRGSDAQTRSTFFEERNTHPVALSGDVPALLVEAPIPVRVIVTTSAAAVAEDETGLHGDPTDDHPENDDDREAVSSPDNDDAVSGEVFVTNTQVLFVSETGDEPGSDLAIGGACVVLHAMTDDPEPSVYLQLSSSSDHDDGTGVVTEVTFVPSSGGSSDCDRLFEALCRLISLHPVEGDDDDGDDDGMFGGAMIGGGFGDDPFGDYGEAVDGLVWAPPPSTDDGPVATNREREAMLEHLDNLLVVAPGLEAKDDNDKGGQFEDAPES